MVYILQGWQWRKHRDIEKRNIQYVTQHLIITSAFYANNVCVKRIEKIRCFWKLFWNIKWNVEFMSCICAILLPWKYLSGVSLSTNDRRNLLLICTNNFSKPTHSGWVFTNCLLRLILKWKKWSHVETWIWDDQEETITE